MFRPCALQEGAGDLETGQKGTPPVCDSVSTLDSGLFSLEWRANRRSSQASSSSASWWGYSSLLGSRSFTAKSYSKPKDVAESNYKALYEEFQRDIQVRAELGRLRLASSASRGEERSSARVVVIRPVARLALHET